MPVVTRGLPPGAWGSGQKGGACNGTVGADVWKRESRVGRDFSVTSESGLETVSRGCTHSRDAPGQVRPRGNSSPVQA